MNRWWRKKYRTPPKPYDDYTWEELLIEMLEDYYENHPQEAERFLAGAFEIEWDGRTSAVYEKQLKEKNKKFFERNKVDLTKWQTKKEVTDEEEKSILENLGRKLPGSIKETKGTLGSGGEFEDDFGG
jgi:hypothetical protein